MVTIEGRFPKIIGLIGLAGLALGGPWLMSKINQLGTRASATCTPENITISNKTNRSFSLSFITQVACRTSLVVDNRTMVRDVLAKIHYFEVDNLSAGKEYSYEIVGGGERYSRSDMRVKMAAEPKVTTPEAKLAWGRMLTKEDNRGVEGLVYIFVDGGPLLSAKANSEGKWNIPLAISMRDSGEWFIPEANMSEEILITTPEGMSGSLSHNTDGNDPVPDILVGANGEITMAVADAVEVVSGGVGLNGGTVGVATPTTLPRALRVINPEQNATFSTKKPEFFGEASSGQVLEIKVESAEVHEAKIEADSQGDWRWSPPADLEPGEHTLTITSVNPTTKLLETITRKFVVMAADTGVGGMEFTASGSATLAPTATPTLVPTERAVLPSVTVTPPVSGVTVITWLPVLLGVVLLVFGYLFFVVV